MILESRVARAAARVVAIVGRLRPLPCNTAVEAFSDPGRPAERGGFGSVLPRRRGHGSKSTGHTPLSARALLGLVPRSLKEPGGPRSLPIVTPAQATAFQLRRQHLEERGSGAALIRVLADMNGAQAQLLSAAELALWARISELAGDRLASEIWNRKVLLRAWCMRRTLYLLPSRDAALYCRGTARRAEKEIRWMLAHGASRNALETSLRELLDVLASPCTRTELAELLAGRLGVKVESRRGGTGWGNRAKTPWIRFGGVPIPVGYALHLAGARGAICLGPAEGAEATYVRADAWTGEWRDLAPSEAERQLAQRYLRTFAPATPRDYAIWTGMTLTDAKEIWGQISASLIRVDYAGREACALRADLPELQSSSLDQLSVRLLPHFDGFLLGHLDHGNVVARPHHPRVYRAQGWVSPVLLVNGTVAGVWNLAIRGKTLRVRVEPFVGLRREVVTLVTEEAASLARFMGAAQVDTMISRT
jgi:Winged helix DNA-binding domain